MHMKGPFDHCEAAVQALGAVDVSSVSDLVLKSHLLGVQHYLDQLTIHQARVLAVAEQRQVWSGTGARNLAEWLAGETKCNPNDVKDKTKLGEALGKSLELDEAVSKGELSPDAAGELADTINDPPAGADPGSLVDAAKGSTPKEAKKAAERWKDIHSTKTPEELEAERYAKRSVKTTAPSDGLATTTITLPILQHREFHNVLAFLGGKPSKDDDRTTPQRLADGLMALCHAFAKGEVKGGNEKPTILIRIDADDYTGANPNGVGITDHGDLIPAHIVRQLADDANLRLLITKGEQILWLGRSERYATRPQYLALMARDSECRWPGCHHPAAWCDADHIVPWETGGMTDLENLWLLCRHHHTVKHSPGVRVTGTVDDITIQLPNGTNVHCPLKRPRTQAAA
jgi:5-methylcytosine-specific restriction endonuclease McrA